MAKKKKKQRTKKKVLKTPQKKENESIHPVRDSTDREKHKEKQISNGVKKTKIRVIGIGGGAGSIISEIVFRIKKADFVVANTDSRALKAVKKAKRFQFGQNLTGGLGTGMDVVLGEMAGQNEKEKIKRLFKGFDLCIIIACLGGGTGSGATPIFARIAKNSGCLTYGIFTLPFEFEGSKKMEIAKESLEKIKPNFNAFSIIPNERIFQIIDKNTPLKNALSAINQRLAKNLEGLIEMIYLPGLINIDFADLKTILTGRGRLTYLSTTEIEEPSISSPLYPYTIKGARAILYNIVGGKNLQISDISQISKLISDSVNKNAKIIFGISQNQKEKDKIKITLLATGCGMREKTQKPIPKIKKKLKKPKAKIKIKRVVKSKRIVSQKKPTIQKQKPVSLNIASVGGGKVRRNALQVRKVIEEEEKEISEKEKIWETPAILRRKQ